MKRIICALLLAALMCLAVVPGVAEDSWTCPNCGHSGNTLGFCPNCGQKRPDAATSTLTSAAAEAVESGQCGDNLTWTLDSQGTLTIRGQGDMWDNRSFQNSKGIDIKAVVIESGVTSIGDDAFRGEDTMNNLKRISIADTVTRIGDRAFFLSGLENVTIPASVTEIGEYAFGECQNLTSAEVLGNISKIATGTFYKCTSLRQFTIPNTVSWIDSSAFYASGIETITIPGSVESISYYAFKYCASLREVQFERGPSAIYEMAFANCTSLKSLDIPEGLRQIDNNVFSDSGLERVLLPGGLEKVGKELFSATNLKELHYGGDKKEWDRFGVAVGANCETYFNDIAVTAEAPAEVPADAVESGQCGDNLTWSTDSQGTLTIRGQGDMWKHTNFNYSKGTGIQAVVIESGVTSINESAFQDMTKLKRVSIPDTVTSIGDRAFYKSGLESVTIPASVTEIGEFAFGECQNLTSAEILGNIPRIASRMFYKCSSLGQFTIPNTVSWIGPYAFYASKLETITIPGSVDTISYNAFQYCTSLREVKFEHGPFSIKSMAFGACTSLKSLDIPEGVHDIDDYVFSGSGLERISLPGGIAVVGKEAFSSTNLKEFHFGGSKKDWDKLGIAVGTNCEMYFDDIAITADIVEYGSCGDNVTWKIDRQGTLTISGKGDMTGSIRRKDDKGVAIQAAVIESGVTSISSALSGIESLKRVSIPGTVTRIEDYAFYETGLERVVIPSTVTEIGESAFAYCKNLESVELPGGIDVISDGLFKHCEKLRQVTIPYSVTSIGESAFYGTGLEMAEIPGNVKRIGDQAYSYCEALQTVRIDPGLTEIGDDAFMRCKKLTSITIPEGVTSIGKFALSDTGLERVSIPGSVRTVGENLFNSTTLKDFSFGGTLEQWDRFGVSVGRHCTKHFTDVTAPGLPDVTPLPPHDDIHGYAN